MAGMMMITAVASVWAATAGAAIAPMPAEPLEQVKEPIAPIELDKDAVRQAPLSQPAEGVRAVAPAPATTFAGPGGEAALAWATPPIAVYRRLGDPDNWARHQMRLINPDTAKAAAVQVQCFDAEGEALHDMQRVDIKPRAIGFWEPDFGTPTASGVRDTYEGWCQISASHPIFAIGELLERDRTGIERTSVEYFRAQ